MGDVGPLTYKEVLGMPIQYLGIRIGNKLRGLGCHKLWQIVDAQYEIWEALNGEEQADVRGALAGYRIRLRVPVTTLELIPQYEKLERQAIFIPVIPGIRMWGLSRRKPFAREWLQYCKGDWGYSKGTWPRVVTNPPPLQYHTRTCDGPMTYAEVMMMPVHLLGYHLGYQLYRRGLETLGEVVARTAAEISKVVGAERLDDVRGLLFGYRLGLRGESFSFLGMSRALNRKLSDRNVDTPEQLLQLDPDMTKTAIHRAGRVPHRVACYYADKLWDKNKITPLEIQEIIEYIGAYFELTRFG